jgi:hypothetical protein
LRANKFLQEYPELITLKTAFELGVIDYLVQNGKSSIVKLSEDLKLPLARTKELIALLGYYKIIKFSLNKNIFYLSLRFLKALNYRDYLMANIIYTGYFYEDLLTEFTNFIEKGYFSENWQVSKLWQYQTSETFSEKTKEKTQKWVSSISIWTKYYSCGLIVNFDFNKINKVLDIGGNNGALALELCKNFKQLKVDVLDTPVVCSIGRDFLNNVPEASRIKFIEGDFNKINFPEKYDVILFKSVLNDWDDEKACNLIKKAFTSLPKQGKIIIYELEKMQTGKAIQKHFIFLNFNTFLRTKKDYQLILKKTGFKHIQQKSIDQLGFFMIEGTKL